MWIMRWCPRSRVEPGFPASGTLLFHVCNHPPLNSLSVIRRCGNGGCGPRHHGACFLVSSIRPGKNARFSSCIVGRMGSRNFFNRAFLAPSPNQSSRFSRIETLVRYLSYPFFDPTQLLRSETPSSDEWTDHNNKVPYSYSSPYVLRSPLGISSACCYGQVPDVSRHPRRNNIFINPRDQLTNNNKGEKKRNNYATLGDVQHNSAIMMTNKPIESPIALRPKSIRMGKQLPSLRASRYAPVGHASPRTGGYLGCIRHGLRNAIAETETSDR
jgi:hypothetical protein